MLAALENGDILRADELLSEDFETAYLALTQRLGDAQGGFAEAITRAETDAGRVERLTQLVVTLLIPAAAIIINQLVVRRQYRERRLQIEAKLDAERKLSRARDEFIAGMSHELRTPLTSIYGFSEYLLDQGLIDPDEAIELIAMINRDSADLSRMIEDLLAAARLEAGRLPFEATPVDLLSIAQTEAHRLRREGKSIQVHGEAAHVWADPALITHVVRNLTSNALRYGGNKIDIVVTNGATVAKLMVADDGPGVPAEVRDRMFERFVNDGERTLLNGSIGLGLSVASALTEEMDGTIEYEHRLGWTNLIVTMPTAPADIQGDALVGLVDEPTVDGVTVGLPSGSTELEVVHATSAMDPSARVVFDKHV